MIISSKVEGHDWYIKDGKILPVWYIGEQLPESITRRKTIKLVNSLKYANKSDVADDDDAE